MSKRYPINEIFYSLQGEGFHTGCPAVFVRFAGCNLRCPFCDTQHQKSELMTTEEIVDKINELRGKCEFVVLTGGEPTLYITEELVEAIKKLDVVIAVETNGTREVKGRVDWVTVSPKADFVEGADVVLESADEIKVVYDGKHDVSRWDYFSAGWKFLQPCDTKDEQENKRILDECIEYIKAHPWWTLSLQTQKITQIR